MWYNRGMKSEHLRALDDRRFTVLACDWLNRRNDPPLPIFVWKDAN